MKLLKIFIICLIVQLISCEKNSTQPIEYRSIIGKIVDRASEQGVDECSVKIVSESVAYETTTASNGLFSFNDIQKGNYMLITEMSQSGKTINDTCGYYDTDTPDWGLIYSEIFVSIKGTITLEGKTDYSLIKVQLLGTDKSAFTTNQGKFRLDFIFPGVYDLYISKDKEYDEIKIIDIDLDAGQIYEIDTAMVYKFRPLVLEPRSDLNFLSNAYHGFCYREGFFYYACDDGFYKYDPNSELHIKIWDKNISPDMAYDYSNYIWLSGYKLTDTLDFYKYSIIDSKMVDSLSQSNISGSYNKEIAWDPSNNFLVGITFTSCQILAYSFDNNSVTIYSPVIDVFDPNEYKQLSFNNIFIDPDGKIYITMLLIDFYDKWHTYLFIWDNLRTLNLIGKYIFPSSFHYMSSLSYYDGKIYTVGWNNKIVSEIIF